jgi:hypothetical protein
LSKVQGRPRRCAAVRLALVLAALALTGCASQPKLADCGLAAYVPARPIDEGWRFDVQEIVGSPAPLSALSYRFLNRTAAGDQEEVFAGNVGELRDAQGNDTLRFLDAGDDHRFGVGDAFVVRVEKEMTLQLSEGSDIVGTSKGCEA